MPSDSQEHFEKLVNHTGANWMEFGPSSGDQMIPIPSDFHAYETEYAAIRRRVGIMLLPQRGLLELRGADVRDLLHRMLTQDICTMTSGQSRRALQLTQKGRILCDLYVHFGDSATWLEADAFDLPALRSLLESRLFSEDVTIEDITRHQHQFALHGPAATDLLQKMTRDNVDLAANSPGTHHVFAIDQNNVTVTRRDLCGVLGFCLIVPSTGAASLYEHLLEAVGFEPDAMADPMTEPHATADLAERRRHTLRGRPVGWLAFNTARIEAGTTIFHVDYGTDSLPAEAGSDLLAETVSFTKGCYLGQEIVARMHNLGHPKRVLVGLHTDSNVLPVAGTAILPLQQPDPPSDNDAVIGAITSSTASPMLGDRPIAFATMKWGHHQEGTPVSFQAQGTRVQATVCNRCFYRGLHKADG